MSTAWSSRTESWCRQWAPADDPGAGAPQWGVQGANLTATVNTGTVLLKWNNAAAAAGYDVYRADEQGRVHIEDAVKVAAPGGP